MRTSSPVWRNYYALLGFWGGGWNWGVARGERGLLISFHNTWGPDVFFSVAGGCLHRWNFLNSKNIIVLSHRLGISFFGTAALIFFPPRPRSHPPPSGCTWLGIGKKKKLIQISPDVLGLVKSLEMWALRELAPSPLHHACMCPWPQALHLHFFLVQSSHLWVSAIIDPFLSHSWSLHIVGGSNLCFRLQSFFLSMYFQKCLASSFLLLLLKEIFKSIY